MEKFSVHVVFLLFLYLFSEMENSLHFFVYRI